MLTPLMFIIVCPCLFLAGVVDSIAGGGGLISLPAYLLTGLPVHSAIATNKFSSTFGTSVSTARYIRRGLVNVRLAVPSVICGMAGSALGARLSLLIPEHVLKILLLIVLPLAAVCVLNRHLFKDGTAGRAVCDRRTVIVALAAALVIGAYDGMYGPGTGTFLIIAFTVFARLGIAPANAHTKVINLSSNIAALAVFLVNGQVVIPLGLAAAASNMLGNYIGSGFALSKGSRIAKPVIIFVLSLLAAKIIMEFVTA